MNLPSKVPIDFSLILQLQAIGESKNSDRHLGASGQSSPSNNFRHAKCHARFVTSTTTTTSSSQAGVAPGIFRRG